MSKWKVLVTDYTYDTLTPERNVLKTVDAELITAQCRTEEEVIEAAQDVDGIINQYAPISKNVMDNLNRCKIISRYGVGFDTIDVNTATQQGIMVSNVTDYCAEEVSNHAFALLLASARKIVRLHESIKKGNWDPMIMKPVYRMSEQKLGLIGFGNIPQMLTKKAQAFGLEVMAYDPFASLKTAGSMGVRMVDLDMLCRESDFISVHPPLSEQTRGMLSDEQFTKMKTSAFVINTSRGPVIDEAAYPGPSDRGNRRCRTGCAGNRTNDA